MTPAWAVVPKDPPLLLQTAGLEPAARPAQQAGWWGADAAELKGIVDCGWRLPSLAVFRRVTLPALRPAIGAGGMLVALYTLTDFGAVSLM